MLVCNNLEFSYSSVKQLISVKNFHVLPGEKVWISGPSGSGKSTFLSIVAGLVGPFSGSIYLKSKSFAEFSRNEFASERKKIISYVHQENHFIDHWTVEQNLFLDVSTVSQNTKRLIESFGFQVEDFLKKKVLYLSGGEKQRLSLISVLMQKKELILLDEPTAHLDDVNFNIFAKLLETELKESTVIIVSHDSRFLGAKLKSILFQEMNR